MSLLSVTEHSFNINIIHSIESDHYIKNLWPIVYILGSEATKNAYVGETTDAIVRVKTHLKDEKKDKIEKILLITSEKFNKSATLDIESNLIKYIAGDGKYKLLNANIGIANHNYYQKQEIYWSIFKDIWNTLRGRGFVTHSLNYIDNSDLFKYSPYKSLTIDQTKSLLTILKGILGNHKSIIIEGGAGTGKSILAVFLFKILHTKNFEKLSNHISKESYELVELALGIQNKYPNLRMALVVPMASFRSTLKSVFKNIKDLKGSMVVGPADIARDRFDIIVVDESHRLRRRVNIGTYLKAFDNASEKLGLDKNTSNELDWVLKQSHKSIFFYDESQSIKPTDVRKESFDTIKKLANTKIETLTSQFRVKGGNDYVSFITNILNGTQQVNLSKQPKNYELLLFSSIQDMIDRVKKRDKEYGLSRLIAGYSWKWISKQDDSLFDIEIQNISLRWNSTNKDWINSNNAINEVGCIHTTQGYDLNYTGIIFGKEISYNEQTRQIEVIPDNYHDRYGKQSIKNTEELKEYIINIYKTIMLRGIKGTYIFVCNDALRRYFSSFIPVQSQVKKDTPRIMNIEEVSPFRNAIPIYNLRAAAGSFGENQNVDSYDWVAAPSNFKISQDYFACKVVGESMNKVIPNGSFCMFKRYAGGSRSGKIVLVESTDIHDSDFGSCYTVKEYHSEKSISVEGWRHERIILKPLSTIQDYKPIILQPKSVDQFKIIGEFVCILK